MADCFIPPKRPFKICNSRREEKKGIVCSTLEDLKRIACERFSLRSGCRVFLESDGTEVDTEDYFQFLSPQTLFMVTEKTEQWVRDTLESFGALRLNLSESQESFTYGDEVDSGVKNGLPQSLRQRIIEDPVFFVSLSNKELETLVELQTNELAQQLGCTEAKAKVYQTSAQQELDRRQDIKETTELLRICQKAINRSEGGEEVLHVSKKQKT